MADFRNPTTDRLFTAIAQLRDADECARFFEDVCTIKEIQDMSQRFEAAILLAQGKNYQTISQEAGISTATISRVSRCLNYGSGGYRTAIARLMGKEEP